MDHTKGGVDPALFTFVGSSHQMVEATYLRHGMKERLDKATSLDTSMRRRWRLVWVPIDFRDDWSESA